MDVSFFIVGVVQSDCGNANHIHEQSLSPIVYYIHVYTKPPLANFMVNSATILSAYAAFVYIRMQGGAKWLCKCKSWHLIWYIYTSTFIRINKTGFTHVHSKMLSIALTSTHLLTCLYVTYTVFTYMHTHSYTSRIM